MLVIQIIFMSIIDLWHTCWPPSAFGHLPGFPNVAVLVLLLLLLGCDSLVVSCQFLEDHSSCPLSAHPYPSQDRTVGFHPVQDHWSSESCLGWFLGRGILEICLYSPQGFKNNADSPKDFGCAVRCNSWWLCKDTLSGAVLYDQSCLGGLLDRRVNTRWVWQVPCSWSNGVVDGIPSAVSAKSKDRLLGTVMGACDSVKETFCRNLSRSGVTWAGDTSTCCICSLPLCLVVLGKNQSGAFPFVPTMLCLESD